MPLKQRQVRWLTGVGLALLTLLTRLPFMATTYFEFDSIDFAVATYRFSLEQVTPHMPGYIGHVLLGRFFNLFTTDINQSFVWLSTILSIASVLLMWRAGAQLRGERVGLIAGMLWLFTPLFWFYGEVATVYIHEALFASAILYLSIKLLREPHGKWLLPALAITLSVSGSMRQNSILFFLPVIMYVAWKTHQPLKLIGFAVLLFVAITLGWFTILLAESGGASTYFYYAGKESIFKSQSILFGNDAQVHLAVISKMLFYLFTVSIPVIVLALWYAMAKKDESNIDVLKHSFRSAKVRVLLLTALPPFLFYLLVYFMKAGYLLNVLPSIVLIGALIVDELSILYAKKIKSTPGEAFTLTRPLIVKRAIWIGAGVSVFNILWFIVPFPGKEYKLFADGVTAVSFGNDLSDRLGEGKTASRLLNKAFAYTSSHGVSMVDSINHRVLSVIGGLPPGKVVLDTWWSRWGYKYFPEMPVYDIITYPEKAEVGVSIQNDRVPLWDRVIRVRTSGEIVLLIRPDHPDRALIEKQAQMTVLDPILGIYTIKPNNGTILWKDKTFKFSEM